jgi:hypothetical protein
MSTTPDSKIMIGEQPPAPVIKPGDKVKRRPTGGHDLNEVGNVWEVDDTSALVRWQHHHSWLRFRDLVKQCTWCGADRTDRHPDLCEKCLESEQMGSAAEARHEDLLEGS